MVIDIDVFITQLQWRIPKLIRAEAALTSIQSIGNTHNVLLQRTVFHVVWWCQSGHFVTLPLRTLDTSYLCKVWSDFGHFVPLQGMKWLWTLRALDTSYLCHFLPWILRTFARYEVTLDTSYLSFSSNVFQDFVFVYYETDDWNNCTWFSLFPKLVNIVYYYFVVTKWLWTLRVLDTSYLSFSLNVFQDLLFVYYQTDDWNNCIWFLLFSQISLYSVLLPCGLFSFLVF